MAFLRKEKAGSHYRAVPLQIRNKKELCTDTVFYRLVRQLLFVFAGYPLLSLIALCNPAKTSS